MELKVGQKFRVLWSGRVFEIIGIQESNKQNPFMWTWILDGKNYYDNDSIGGNLSQEYIDEKIKDSFLELVKEVEFTGVVSRLNEVE